MEMVAKRSSLVLPNEFVELDREEMTYVEGGAVYTTTYTNLDGICMLAGIIGGGIWTAVKGFATAAVTGVSVIGAIIGAVMAVAGIVSATYAFCNLISAIISYSNKGYYRWTEHKVFGVTVLYYVS